MINRELIRTKTVQLVYSYSQNPGKSVAAAEKELMFSLSKSYDMYRLLLMLIVKVHEYGVRDLEIQRSRAARLRLEREIDSRFADNRFALQLAGNNELRQFAKNAGADIMDETIVRKLYKAVVECDAYGEYMGLARTDYDSDRAFWRRAYKSCFPACDDLDTVFEEKSLYWNDDRRIVDTFVIKTIKKFGEENGPDQPLLPEYDSEEDCDFAARLVRAALENEEEYRNMIADNAKNWDISRMALMDVVIAQTAIAELVTFPSIPAAVTISEYLDLANAYSTPKSHVYINGLLDFLVRKLRVDGRIMK